MIDRCPPPQQRDRSEPPLPGRRQHRNHFGAARTGLPAARRDRRRDFRHLADPGDDEEQPLAEGAAVPLAYRHRERRGRGPGWCGTDRPEHTTLTIVADMRGDADGGALGEAVPRGRAVRGGGRSTRSCHRKLGILATLRRAKSKLGVKVIRHGFGDAGAYPGPSRHSWITRNS